MFDESSLRLEGFARCLEESKGLEDVNAVLSFEVTGISCNSQSVQEEALLTSKISCSTLTPARLAL